MLDFPTKFTLHQSRAWDSSLDIIYPDYLLSRILSNRGSQLGQEVELVSLLKIVIECTSDLLIRLRYIYGNKVELRDLLALRT